VGDDHALRTDIELILGRAASMLRLARQEPEAKEGEAAAPAAPAPPAPPAVPGRPAAEPGAPRAPADEPAAAGEEIAIAAGPAPEPSAPAPAPAPAEAQPRLAGDVERLLVEGSVKMTVGDYANAVRSYVKLCELEPAVAAYRVRLAVAMACYPRTAKSAERQFLEAIRIEPNSADIHFQFGIYYRAMKVRSRAVAEFRTALSLDPRHKQARAELEALAPKDSALTSLKKLFR
jgi:tetratricopeptide (TPR) repeat protein